MSSQDETYDIGVIHGRFQVLHNDHLKYLLSGKDRCRHIVVGITNAEPEMIKAESTDPQRSTPLANPLTYFERFQLVRAVLEESGVDSNDYSIVPLPISHPDRYRFYVPLDAVFFLSIYDDWGRHKKQNFESLGLRTCVLRDVRSEEKGISAMDVRHRILCGEPWKHMVPGSTAALLEKWNINQRLHELNRTIEVNRKN